MARRGKGRTSIHERDLYNKSPVLENHTRVTKDPYQLARARNRVAYDQPGIVIPSRPAKKPVTSNAATMTGTGPAHASNSSPNVRAGRSHKNTDQRLAPRRCKSTPQAKAGGSGKSRPFIPWCK
jgi:hypothetical protein